MPTVTIRDIAQMAGVSIGTVSRVLNHAENIDPEIYSRTMDVVRRYKYKPGKRGRRPVSLSEMAGLSRNIALWSPKMSPLWQGNPMWAMYIAGIEKVCSSRGYDLVVKMGDVSENFLREALYGGSYAGILLKTSNLLDQMEDFNKVADRLPVLGFGLYMPGYNFPQICSDNNAAGVLAAKELLKLGHRRIAFLNTTPTHRMLIARGHGFMEIMKENMLFRPEYFYEEKNKAQDFPVIPNDSLPDCTAAVKHFLQLDEMPTAVVAANDWTALGFLKSCSDAGISVPRQISLVSIDDIGSFCRISSPSISTVSMPFTELTEYAGHMLIDCVEAPDIYFSRRPSAQYLPGRFVKRESVVSL